MTALESPPISLPQRCRASLHHGPRAPPSGVAGLGCFHVTSGAFTTFSLHLLVRFCQLLLSSRSLTLLWLGMSAVFIFEQLTNCNIWVRVQFLRHLLELHRRRCITSCQEALLKLAHFLSSLVLLELVICLLALRSVFLPFLPVSGLQSMCRALLPSCFWESSAEAGRSRGGEVSLLPLPTAGIFVSGLAFALDQLPGRELPLCPPSRSLPRCSLQSGLPWFTLRQLQFPSFGNTQGDFYLLAGP